jgi:nucleotide-binding universal stress UspA family protein
VNLWSRPSLNLQKLSNFQGAYSLLANRLQLHFHGTFRTAVVAERAADEAILSELDRRNHNLVVLGVGRRPGEKLFFGDTAAKLLKKSGRSLLFVAS